MFVYKFCVANDGVGINVEKSSCFSHSASLVDMFENGDDFFFD